jgi:enoyl-CoA hydratase/carnithine racemase
MSTRSEIERVEGGIASFRVATDAAPALDEAVLARLARAVAAVEADETIRAVLVEGGERTFSSGARPELLLGADPAASVGRFCADAPRLLLAMPVPTIAVMAGHATAGGFVFGLWCDIAVLAEESLYGASFMALGFTPGMGATVRLEEALGAPLARELLFTGRLAKGRELRQGGGPLAHAVLPRADVRARALAIARDLEAVPRAALTLLKRTLAARSAAGLARATEEERAMHARIFAREETRARLAERFAGRAAEGGA